jgi:coenzyme F420-0:L-glutamate ligase/coenzyme F420-1:gamma-L-glutamate ligase
MSDIHIYALPGLPEIRPGDDLAALIADACGPADLRLHDGDVVAVAQKAVSKAEGRIRALEDVVPSQAAVELAAETGKDPRLVELMLGESSRVLRWRPGLTVVEHRLGFVCANAGIDRSNIVQDQPGRTLVALLPVDPDGSARALRGGLQERLGVKVAVLIVDSHGRPFREGAVGVAIGVAGMRPLTRMVGWSDRNGYRLRSTEMATADELAAAASLVMGQSAESRPVAIVRGARYQAGEGCIGDLLRARERDMFR